MNPPNKIISTILSIIVVNILGFLLRLFQLDTYFIFIGFRFYLGLVVPFIITFRKTDLLEIKQAFLKPEHNKAILPVMWIIAPYALLLILLFFFNAISIGDPEYFYEFGLSSIFDLPIYIAWNLPQLLLFSSFILFLTPQGGKNILYTALTVFSLFVFQIWPFGKESINYSALISLILLSLAAGILAKYFRNVYWVAVFFFMIFWLNFLSFGTGSQVILHMVFAAEYSNWEGFFEIPRVYYTFLFPAQLVVSVIFIYISLKRKS